MSEARTSTESAAAVRSMKLQVASSAIDEISSLMNHIEGHLSFAREFVGSGEVAQAYHQLSEVAGWAEAIVDEVRTSETK